MLKNSSPGLLVLPSVKRVVGLAGFVCFHPDRVVPAISQWGRLLDAAPSWDHPCHFFDGTEETVRWIFTLDVLNHCFWPDEGEPVWTVRYQDENWSGYWGLAAALKRAREVGLAVTDPLWLSKIKTRDMEDIFSYFPPHPLPTRGGERFVPPARGKTGSASLPVMPEHAHSRVRQHGTSFSVKPGRIPLFSKRLMNLREAGSVILEQLDGDVASLLDSAAGSAVRLVKEVIHHFPSFRDEAVYRGTEVFFWKRAQIFAADVYAAFGGKGLGNFHDIGELTAFADYKLPQVLRELGIISYSPELAEKVDGLIYLEPGSEQEVEIRAMTVVAVDEIRKAFESDEGGIAARSNSRPRVSSVRVDAWLWQLGQMDEFRKRPYHRCRTIFY